MKLQALLIVLCGIISLLSLQHVLFYGKDKTVLGEDYSRSPKRFEPQFASSEMDQRSEFHGMLRLPGNFVPRKQSRVINLPLTKEKKETTIFELKGAGCVQLLQFTFIRAHTGRMPDCVDANLAKALRVRIYVDGLETPVVDEQLNRLFGLHHPEATRKRQNEEKGIAMHNLIYSLSANGCFFLNVPMPYASQFRITLQDMVDDPIDMCVWNFIEYEEYRPEEFKETARFHAKYSQEVDDFNTFHAGSDVGSGYLLGVSFGVTQGKAKDTWYHSSGETIMLDTGLDRVSVIHGLGGEDFFHDTCSPRKAYAFPSYGIQYSMIEDPMNAVARPVLLSGYRIWADIQKYPFSSSFSVTFGCNTGDTCEGTVYWYKNVKSGEKNPLVKGREFRLSNIMPLGITFSAINLHTYEAISSMCNNKVILKNSFVEVSRIIGHMNVRGNAKYAVDAGLIAVGENFFEELCGDGRECCVELDVLHDDKIEAYVGMEKVFAGSSEAYFRWGRSKPFKITGSHPLVLLVANEINMNYRLFGFGAKAMLSSKCAADEKIVKLDTRQVSEGCKKAKEAYLKKNEDVRSSGGDPWLHFKANGQAEGREWVGEECN